MLACGFTGVATRSNDARPDEDASAADPDLRDAVASPLDGAADGDAFPSDAATDPTDAGPTTAVGATTVAPNSLGVDLVRPGDGAIMTDGVKDGVVDVQVTGPAVALTLIRTNAAGAPMNNQQWDTWVGADAIPADLGGGFAVGSTTYQAGVFEGATVLNDASGRLTLSAGPHTLRIAGANVGSFVAGTHLRVVLEAPDGTLVRGPVLTY